MISLTFPDGSVRQYEVGTSGRDVAGSIAKSLEKKAVAVMLNGQLADLADPIKADADFRIITRDDAEALELIRHDAAHVMAEAVQELWPGTQVTIGPVIENGFFYDFKRNEPFTPEDLPVIEKKMREIIQRNKPFTKEVWNRDKAKQVFRDKGEMYKVELIDAIPDEQDVKIYHQGDWFDLCRGPHMASTGQIGNAFKLMKVAGAYWRGDSNNEMLTRIYGTAWSSQADLEGYLHMLEEAEKRDHRKLGREMDLFHFQEEGPGVVFWHAKGWRMFQNLVNYMRRRLEGTYEEVNAPQILDKALWETSGHWGWYKENMFVTETEDERVFAIKPMNCPGHVQIFKHGLKSYRELPIRLAEFGNVHRYEPSGALHGLMRVRGFVQDDGHIFCTEDQILGECAAYTALLQRVYRDFGFTDIIYRVATRPAKRIGEDALWDKAERALIDSLRRSGVEFEVTPGEGAFYGPKIDFSLRDAIGRVWQLGTVQLDFAQTERLGAHYVAADGSRQVPVMIHRAVLGSLERFIGILIENHAGALPMWLAPTQAVVMNITEHQAEYAHGVAQTLKKQGFRVESDLRNEKINYKIRQFSLQKVPYLLVVGDKERQAGTVAVRARGGLDLGAMPVTEFVERLSGDISARRAAPQPKAA